MSSKHALTLYPDDPDRWLISAQKAEFESADEMSWQAWDGVSQYLTKFVPDPPSVKTIVTAYLDTINPDGTPRLDLWHSAGLTLRDRPQAHVGNRLYPNEFILKGLNAEYTAAARQVAQHAGFQPDAGASAILVRDEIEEKHPQRRDENRKLYAFSDLSPAIQSVLEDRVGAKVHDMTLAPVFSIFAHRRRYPMLVDPDAETNFLMPVSHPVGAKFARVQVGMDEWHARLAPRDKSIYEVLTATDETAQGFKPVLGGYSAEREFRLKGSGGEITDRDAVVAYARVGAELYRIASQHTSKGDAPAIRPIGSKAGEIIAKIKSLCR